MNIIFIVPNTESLAAAGVRIRYKRLEPFFNKKNCSIKIIPLQNISYLEVKSADVVILSKIFTVDSLHIISLCHTLKVNVGIDYLTTTLPTKISVYLENSKTGLN